MLGLALVLLTLAALIRVLTAPARAQQAPSHSGYMHEQIPSFAQLFIANYLGGRFHLHAVKSCFRSAVI